MDVELRDHRPDDLRAIEAWAGDREVSKTLTFGPLDRSACEVWLAEAVAEPAASRRERWSLAIVVDDAVVGVVVISEDSNEHRRAEIGFAVRQAAWGRGVGSCAVADAVAMAFGALGYHRVWAICDPDNFGAHRVLERSGFQREGLLRDDLVIDGERRDSIVYGRLRTDSDPGGR